MERYEIDAPETPETEENFSEAPSNYFMKPLKLINSRKYETNYGEDIYSLLLEMYSNDTISFKLKKINDLSLYQYANRYNYNQLVKLLSMQNENYKNMDQIFVFIDIAIINKQLKIDYDKEKNIMSLKIRKYLNSMEECKLVLNNIRTPQDELLGLLVEEVKKYKKINIENNNKINELNNKIEGNEDYINKLENKIINLEEEVNTLKKEINNNASRNTINNYNIIGPKKEEENYTKPKMICDMTKVRSEYCGKLRNFDVFIGLKDKIEYLIFNTRASYNLEIMRIYDKKIINSLKGHKCETTVIRYYLKKYNEDYILSSDRDKLTIIWDIQNNFNKKYSIITNYAFLIWDALLLFNVYNKDYILISCGNLKEHTKLFEFSYNTPFVRDIYETDKNETYYMIPWWYNNKYYIIECCDKGKITIHNLFENEVYAALFSHKLGQHLCGYIYNQNYLCVSDSGSKFIVIWNLVNKTIYKQINININFGSEIFPLNNNLTIVGCENGFAVVNIEEGKVVSRYKLDEDFKSVKGIKKINVKNYGECLIVSCWSVFSVSGKGDSIKLFVI